MKLGDLKRLDREFASATGAQAVVLHLELGAWLDRLPTWIPSTRREVVQAACIARHMLASTTVPETEALDELRACLSGIVSGVRTNYPGTARAMRLIVEQGARAGLDPEHDGPEWDALQVIARAARPGAGRGRPYRDTRALSCRAL